MPEQSLPHRCAAIEARLDKLEALDCHNQKPIKKAMPKGKVINPRKPSMSVGD